MFEVLNQREDFAETAAFIVSFSYTKTKPPLGKPTEALITKMRKTAEIIGTPKEVVEEIIEYYSR